MSGCLKFYQDCESLLLSGATYHGDGVLADILEPDKFEGAGPVAVHTLSLVLADDDVLERGAGLEVEDGVLPVFKGH